jgi:hypothetical protein
MVKDNWETLKGLRLKYASETLRGLRGIALFGMKPEQKLRGGTTVATAISRVGVKTPAQAKTFLSSLPFGGEKEIYTMLKEHCVSRCKAGEKPALVSETRAGFKKPAKKAAARQPKATAKKAAARQPKATAKKAAAKRQPSDSISAIKAEMQVLLERLNALQEGNG